MITRSVSRNLHISDVRQSSNYPSAAADAVVTIAAPGADKVITIHRIIWSYTAAGAGRLTIADGNTADLVVDITAAGPGSLSLNRTAAVNNSSVVTLLGVATITGRLTVEYTIDFKS